MSKVKNATLTTLSKPESPSSRCTLSVTGPYQFRSYLHWNCIWVLETVGIGISLPFHPYEAYHPSSITSAFVQKSIITNTNVFRHLSSYWGTIYSWNYINFYLRYHVVDLDVSIRPTQSINKRRGLFLHFSWPNSTGNDYSYGWSLSTKLTYVPHVAVCHFSGRVAKT